MFVGGREVYYTGGVPPPTNQRKKAPAGRAAPGAGWQKFPGLPDGGDSD